MSFRGRLRVFFTLIVLVPLAAVTVVALSLTASSERGKADSGLATGLQTAFGLHREAVEQARPALREVAADRELADSIVDGDGQAAAARMRQLVRQPGGPVAIELVSPRGRTVARAGSEDGIAGRIASLDGPGGRRAGTLEVSVADARGFARRLARLTGFEAAVYRDGRRLAATDRDAPADPPSVEAQDFDLGGDEFRGRAARLDEAAGPSLEVLLLRPATPIDDRIADNRVAIAAIVAAFLLAALGAATLVGRALTGQVGRFLTAARRLARGDFSRPVPVSGRDEFAQLGTEFNSMSDQLEAKIEEVERKRQELEETIRRVGDALATGLERQGVIDLAVRQAVDACEADVGRAFPLDSVAFERAEAGSGDSALDAALEAAERRAFEPTPNLAQELLDDEPPTRRRRSVIVSGDGVRGAAVAMRSVVGAAGTAAEYVGVLSIARHGAPFTREQLELLEYLAGQSVVSIENASLHETVERQAVTDELTGLANVRAFQTILARELERSRRFDGSLGLVMLDIDNFKKVNDTHGHQTGDQVLAAVAGVLRDLSRDVDAPARYGGEEMAVVLPGTDVEGAAQQAERMRQAVERLRTPLPGGGELRVTVSFGAAAAPESAADEKGLIAAADEALYRAKHGGKNRVERAEPVAARG